MPQLSFEGDLVHSTPLGRAVLENPSIQQALRAYHESETPEKVTIPGITRIGEGRFSCVGTINGIALKISSPSSGTETSDGKPRTEDLPEQFTTLNNLGEYLQGSSEGISTPLQIFVTQTPYGAYILGQQFMDGWVSFEQRTFQEYGPADTVSTTAKEEIGELSIRIATRIARAIRHFPFRQNLNDLIDTTASGIWLHGGNILVPAHCTLRDTPPLCIIDQPGPW